MVCSTKFLFLLLLHVYNIKTDGLNVDIETAVDIPLIDTLEAPLKAELDISKLNKQIKALIVQKVKEGLHDAVQNAVYNFEIKLKEAHNQLQENVNKTLETFERQQIDKKSKLGFLVTNSKHLENLAAGSIVIYDTIISNIGNGYSSSSGKFTAPSDDLYFFSWTSLTIAGSSFFTELIVNGKRIALNHASARGISTEQISASQSVVISLKKNDQVCIRVISTGRRLWTNRWSSFSGFRI